MGSGFILAMICMWHPSMPAEAIDENVALRYALVQPVKRQMWDYVSDGNEGEHDGD